MSRNIRLGSFLHGANRLPQKRKNPNFSPENEIAAVNFSNDFFDYPEMQLEVLENGAEKLYPGSFFTTSQFFNVILLLARIHNLNDNVMNSILHMFNTFLPIQNKCPKDYRTFRNNMEKDSEIPTSITIEYCKTCKMENTVCKCKKKEFMTGSVIFFDMIKQIENIFDKWSEAASKYKEKLENLPKNGYFDVLNGSVIDKIDDETIYLALYTDGASINSSSTKSLWLLGATILNLPLTVRSSLQNFVYIFGFYGENKPPWYCLTRKLVRQMRKTVRIGDKMFKLKILQVQGDIQAQCSLINLKFGGYFPCAKCKVDGVMENKLITYKKYKNTPRTSSEYVEDSNKALQTGESVGPIAGLCALRQVLIIPTCLTIDYMHTVLGGPIKSNLIELLSDSKIKDVAEAVISFMPNSIFPSEMKGRRISKIENIGKYKASEWKLVMNYVSIIVFIEIIGDKKILGKNWQKKQEQMLNVLHGIAGVMGLCLDYVSEDQLEHSNRLLVFWFDNREDKLWNDNPWLPKAHMMTHLVEQVRCHGPLHKSSCFPGESIMGMAAKKITSNNPEIILNQICRRTQQTTDILQWAESNSFGPLKNILKFLLKSKTNQEFSYEIPLDTPIARQFGSSKLCGLRNIKICGYNFEAEGYGKTNNSVTYYHTGRNIRPAIIEHIYQENAEIVWIQLKPLRIQMLFEVAPELSGLLRHKNSFEGYGSLIGQDDSIVIKAEAIRRKGFIISGKSKNYVVPLLHVYEHN